MKRPNSEIIESGKRKGRNKKNEGFRVKMDFYFILFLFLKTKNKLKFFSYFIKKLQKN